MNSIKLAMRTAGVPMPSPIKRIWLWVKDHPERTYKDIASALNEPLGRVASRLSEMKARKMLSIKLDTQIGKTRKIMRFTVTQKTFELLPLPPKKSLKADFGPIVEKGVITGFGLSAIPVTKDSVASFVPPKAKFDLDTLNVREAFELYKELHTMFKGSI